MSEHDHSRVTPEGRALGAQLVRLTEPWIERLAADGEPDERCKGWPCHGWFAARVAMRAAEAKRGPFPATCPWPFSPPDEATP